HSNEALARRAYPRASRVLDVGCGFGDSTQLIAEQIGPHGEAVGVDCAERFVDAAHRDARAHDVANASFFVADVQTDDLRGPYDADSCIGGDLDDGVECPMALGPAGEIMRLAQDEGEKRKPQVVAALRETLSRYARDGGLWAPSSTWFVTARNP